MHDEQSARLAAVINALSAASSELTSLQETRSTERLQWKKAEEGRVALEAELASIRKCHAESLQVQVESSVVLYNACDTLLLFSVLVDRGGDVLFVLLFDFCI